MSRTFLESFFPTLIDTYLFHHNSNSNSSLHSFHYTIYNNLLLPKDVMELCSEIIVTVPIPLLSTTITTTTGITYNDNDSVQQGMMIRNPVLYLFAMIGAIFGIYVSLFDPTVGLLRIYHSTKLQQQQQHTLQDSIYWSISFLFFGLMNVAAIPLHCLLSVVSDDTSTTTTTTTTHAIVPLPQQYPYLWMMDTFCTGVFALSLIMVQLQLYTSASKIKMKHYWYNNYLFVVLLIVLCGCVVIGRFLIYDSSLELELWYIVPLVVASAVVPLFSRPFIMAMVHPQHSFTSSSPSSRKQPVVYYYYIISLFWLLSGIVIDQVSCRWSIAQERQRNLSWWWDLTRLPAIAFGACDLMFIGLYHYLRTDVFASTTISSIYEGKKRKYQ